MSTKERGRGKEDRKTKQNKTKTNKNNNNNKTRAIQTFDRITLKFGFHELKRENTISKVETTE
jgi:ribosomal protein S25